MLKRAGEYDNARGLGEKFLSLCDVDKDLIEAELQDMKERWEKLVPTQSNASNSWENMQETKSAEDSFPSLSSSSMTQATIQRQTVTLVSSQQYKTAPQNTVPLQQMVKLLPAARTYTSASLSTSADNQYQLTTMNTLNRRISSKYTMTTSHAGHKRQWDNETDSTEDISSDHGKKKPPIKEIRTQVWLCLPNPTNNNRQNREET